MANAKLSSNWKLLVPVLVFNLFSSLVIQSHVAMAGAAENDEVSGVPTDHFMQLNQRAGSRFLAVQAAVKKGAQCDLANNICPGIPAKDGTQLLYCCKNHCRNVLTDRNNCGACGNKCGFGQLCCNSKCTTVAYDIANCGKCGNVCQPGLRCEYGSCGYA